MKLKSLKSYSFVLASITLPWISFAQQEIQLGPDTLGLDDTTAFQSVTKSLMVQNLTPDMPIVRALDSVANIMFFQDHYLLPPGELQTFYPSSLEQIPRFSDSVIANRIEDLNRVTPFEMVYNQHVRDFIELYGVRKRALTSRVLGLAAIYFPLFEEMLDKYNMPLELKYLAVVESALNPTAVSRAGARGLWQFMYNTGKLYGLKANSLVDDRSDPYKATDAACRHLRDLYELYGSWSLALAAYNSGAGNVNKAIRRAGGVKNYWAIWPYLPRETRGYVPAFIAVNYIMSYSTEHNIYPLHPGILYGGIDTVQVNDVLAFDQISEFLGIPIDQVRFLNPAYKEGIVPATPDKKYIIRLPREKIADFMNNEKAIYQYKTIKGIEREKLLAKIKTATERSVHVVRKGETLGGIAKKYHCRANDLKKWNGLKKNYLRVGQRLVVFPAGDNPKIVAKVDNKKASNTTKENIQPKADTTTKKEDVVAANTVNQDKGTPQNQKSEDSVSTTNSKYHTVKKGETLGSIAKTYNTTVQKLKQTNNLNKTTIKIGQKIKISGSADESKEITYRYYIVKKGDTLYKIADKIAKITVDELKSLNSLNSDATLKVGQKIIIGVN